MNASMQRLSVCVVSTIATAEEVKCENSCPKDYYSRKLGPKGTSRDFLHHSMYTSTFVNKASQMQAEQPAQQISCAWKHEHMSWNYKLTIMAGPYGCLYLCMKQYSWHCYRSYG